MTLSELSDKIDETKTALETAESLADFILDNMSDYSAQNLHKELLEFIKRAEEELEQMNEEAESLADKEKSQDPFYDSPQASGR